MAEQITTTIRTVSGQPDRDDQENFNTQSDDFFEDFPGALSDVNDVGDEMNIVATEVEANAQAAETAKTAAEAAQEGAIAAAGVAAWLSGTTYGSGDVAYGTDFKTYRSAQGSNTNHNPVGDDGTWWVLLTLKALLDEDDMASDSNEQAPTQQSVKAYTASNTSNILQTQIFS